MAKIPKANSTRAGAEMWSSSSRQTHMVGTPCTRSMLIRGRLAIRSTRLMYIAPLMRSDLTPSCTSFVNLPMSRAVSPRAAILISTRQQSFWQS